MIAAAIGGWQWREPLWFAMLAVVVLAIVLRRRARSPMPFAGAGELVEARLPRPLRQRLAALPTAFELLALVSLVAALARPVFVAVEPPARAGRDVMLCLDRSSSMAATDLDPQQSRLDVGRQLAAEFLLARGDDRLGVVAFARYCDLVCPPTTDHDAVLQLLDRVQLVRHNGPEDATAIGAAVGLAANALQRSAADGKVVVLLTDGEENLATAGADDQIAPLHAGQWCRDHGIRVYAITLGRGEQRADGSFRALDTTAVQQLAKISGGRFFEAPDRASLQAVYAAIDRLEAVQFLEPGVRVDEWFALPIAVGLVLLLFAAVAHERLGGAP